jgi:hypothetical protein
MKLVGAIALAAMLAVTPAAAGDDPRLEAGVIFARDHSLWRTDARGKTEPIEVVALPAATAAADVRTLRTDPAGTVLLADIAGTWYWMRLDGATTALSPLACKGTARLAPDASCVLCAGDAGQLLIVNLATGKVFRRAVPAEGAVIAGTGADRRLVWSDAGVWSAPPGDLAKRQAVAPESPLRSLSISPDGSRALGVYAGEVHRGKTTEPAELLFEFALDGTAARRKSIRTGVPVMWSHDSAWALIQDGASACVARTGGGQYKCWKGFTAVSIAPDGAYALVLGQRKGEAKDDAKAGAKNKSRADRKSGASAEGEAGDDDGGNPEVGALPTGPLSLYRAELDGAYTEPPVVVERIVDGAAVWLP